MVNGDRGGTGIREMVTLTDKRNREVVYLSVMDSVAVLKVLNDGLCY